MSDNSNSNEDGLHNSARWMTILAWGSFFALAIWFFSDLLEKQQNPNREVESSFVGNQAEIRLKQNRQGHYVASGEINGESVTFLVDTGATSVSVPAHLATKLKLEGRGSGISRTANGNVTIQFTTINHLQIGDIQLTKLAATINPGMRDNEILLGMSALRQLEFTQRGDWLILRTL